MGKGTLCNFCSLKMIKASAEQTGGTVVIRPGTGGLGGSEVYVVPKGATLDERKDPETGNDLGGQWKSWMMEIPDHCCC